MENVDDNGKRMHYNLFIKRDYNVSQTIVIGFMIYLQEYVLGFSNVKEKADEGDK